MKRLVTIAEFNNTLDLRLSLLKDMLSQAQIPYVVVNENARAVEPYIVSPSNESIEVKIYEDKLEEAKEIVKSIK